MVAGTLVTLVKDRRQEKQDKSEGASQNGKKMEIEDKNDEGKDATRRKQSGVGNVKEAKAEKRRKAALG